VCPSPSAGRLVLYGRGDRVNDYEGTAGHATYRPDLRLPYFASLQPDTGTLVTLRMAPMRARKLRLHRAAAADVEQLRTVLDQASRRFGSRVDTHPDGLLVLRAGGS
jgi:poly-gamma-glutamate capsule biosynthesis protein CapA/YwtB (metallophosphatase superfamily)